MHKLLLIDNRKMWQNLIINTFIAPDYDVAITETFINAVATAVYFKPDVLILDERSTVIGGIKLIDFIKSNSLIDKIPMVLITSETKVAYPENYHKYEPVQLLPRTLNVDMLIKAVEAAVIM